MKIKNNGNKNFYLEELTPENSALLLIDHQVGTNFVSGARMAAKEN